MRRGKEIFIIGMVLGFILLPESPAIQANRKEQIEKDITRRAKDLGEIKKEISLTKKKEKEVLGKESSILENLHALQNELYKKEKELKQMEVQLAQVKERLHQTKGQIVMLSKGMERTKGELFSRLNALYKMGRTPPETFLLTSRSFPDLLKTDKYFRVIIDFDARLVETYRYQVVLKEQYQNELTQDRLQRERNISEVEKKREEIKRIREEKQTLLKSIQNQKVVYQKLIKELEERGRGLEALLQKLEREKNLLSYGKSKPDNFKGKLAPPIHGKVISLFKEKGQNGIEIKAEVGAEIRAVLPGKVLYADWFKGFGNIVIIDHGEHIFTVSGYCSQLLKKAGDQVSQGEVIALVGSAGSLKGPSLYFEIRHQGKPQDPMDWVSHLDKVAFLPGAMNRQGDGA
ncbi:MAG: peptidoglycan DD-metalloendopeptidase family protein [Thermodesulfobacteriota bacterium]|nr:peptidoglycan DD-metalloendopeptidase family protein [Thermodesulfobacteriota bacterium]